MVGLLFQAITNKQMVRFLYKGMTRYVTPIYVEAGKDGAVLHGYEKASTEERVYKVTDMVALRVVDDPDAPETRRYTPYTFELKAKMSVEEKLQKAQSKAKA